MGEVALSLVADACTAAGSRAASCDRRIVAAARRVSRAIPACGPRRVRRPMDRLAVAARGARGRAAGAGTGPGVSQGGPSNAETRIDPDEAAGTPPMIGPPKTKDDRDDTSE